MWVGATEAVADSLFLPTALVPEPTVLMLMPSAKRGDNMMESVKTGRALSTEARSPSVVPRNEVPT